MSTLTNYLIEFPKIYDPQDSHINLVMPQGLGRISQRIEDIQQTSNKMQGSGAF